MSELMNQFDVRYIAPSSIKEAAELLKTYGDKAKPIAGGTALFEFLSRGLLSDLDLLVDIGTLGLDYVRRDGDNLRIGAMATMSSLLDYLSVNPRSGLVGLRECLKIIRPIQVKNVATLGGAVASGIPFLDLPPVLMSLDASIVVHDGTSTRTVSIQNFYNGPYKVDLKQGELISEIIVALPKSDVAAFEKTAFTATDFAFSNCAVASRDEMEQGLRIAVGGMVTMPKRLTALEKAVSGSYAWDSDKLQTTIKENVGEVELNPPHGVPESYLRKISIVTIKNALLKAFKGGPN